MPETEMSGKNDWILRVLGVAVPVAGGGGKATVPGDFGDRWAKVRQQWQDASDAVDAQIAKLRDEPDEELQSIAEFGLNAVTGGHKVPLMAAMRELNAAATAETIADTKDIVDDFIEHLQSDIRVAACDENPFKVQVSVRSTLGTALQAMAVALTL